MEKFKIRFLFRASQICMILVTLNIWTKMADSEKIGVDGGDSINIALPDIAEKNEEVTTKHFIIKIISVKPKAKKAITKEKNHSEIELGHPLTRSENGGFAELKDDNTEANISDTRAGGDKVNRFKMKSSKFVNGSKVSTAWEILNAEKVNQSKVANATNDVITRKIANSSNGVNAQKVINASKMLNSSKNVIRPKLATGSNTSKSPKNANNGSNYKTSSTSSGSSIPSSNDEISDEDRETLKNAVIGEIFGKLSRGDYEQEKATSNDNMLKLRAMVAKRRRLTKMFVRFLEDMAKKLDVDVVSVASNLISKNENTKDIEPSQANARDVIPSIPFKFKPFVKILADILNEEISTAHVMLIS